MDHRKVMSTDGEHGHPGAGLDPAGLDDSAPHRSLRLVTVLVADADGAFLDHVAGIGRARLIDVRVARDADEALLEARRHTLDAAIIDVELGAGELAFELARKLRALDGNGDLPLAFMAREGQLAQHIAAVHAGASLFLTKPLDARAFTAAVHGLEAERNSGRPRVLVLDDEPEVARELAAVLAAQRIEAFSLSDPLAVLEVLERLQPGLLVLDVDMPGLGGLDVCKMLRASARWKDLPVLLATADASEDARIACFEAGGDDYVQKPVSGRELLARIHARLERQRLQRERADRDGLTGLLLRHAFAEALAARLSQAQRDHHPVSIALLDLDGFKRINDVHGHLAGDRVLSGFGKLLGTAFRFHDLRGRWGGEEFVVAFCGEDAASAAAILERTRHELEASVFESDHGTPFRVTFSAGVASYPHDGLAIDQLLQAADRRLHAAKAAGPARIEYGRIELTRVEAVRRRRPDTARWPPLRD
jgi:diguanylate cyclase (GGDEF)-like protein